MTKFKVGDRVRGIAGGGAGLSGTIKLFDPSDGSYKVFFDDGEWSWKLPSNIELLAARGENGEAINFILQYELDRDPFETFATMEEVEARIKELAKRPDLKRESIKVYEIAKTYDVTLETRVIFGGTKVKVTDQPKKPASAKRGRKNRCPDCHVVVNGKSGLSQHRRWSHKPVAA